MEDGLLSSPPTPPTPPTPATPPTLATPSTPATADASDPAELAEPNEPTNPPELLTHCTRPVHEDDPPAEIYKLQGDDNWYINRDGQLPASVPITRFLDRIENEPSDPNVPIDVAFVVGDGYAHLTLDGIQVPTNQPCPLPHCFVNNNFFTPRSVRFSLRLESLALPPDSISVQVHQKVLSVERALDDDDEANELASFDLEPFRVGDVTCKPLLLPYPFSSHAAPKISVVFNKEVERWKSTVFWRSFQQVALASTSTLFYGWSPINQNPTQANVNSRAFPVIDIPPEPDADMRPRIWGSSTDSVIRQLIKTIREITNTFDKVQSDHRKLLKKQAEEDANEAAQKEEELSRLKLEKLEAENLDDTDKVTEITNKIDEVTRRIPSKSTLPTVSLWNLFGRARIGLILQSKQKTLAFLDALLLSRTSGDIKGNMGNYVVQSGTVKVWDKLKLSKADSDAFEKLQPNATARNEAAMTEDERTEYIEYVGLTMQRKVAGFAKTDILKERLAKAQFDLERSKSRRDENAVELAEVAVKAAAAELVIAEEEAQNEAAAEVVAFADPINAASFPSTGPNIVLRGSSKMNEIHQPQNTGATLNELKDWVRSFPYSYIGRDEAYLHFRTSGAVLRSSISQLEYKIVHGDTSTTFTTEVMASLAAGHAYDSYQDDVRRLLEEIDRCEKSMFQFHVGQDVGANYLWITKVRDFFEAPATNAATSRLSTTVVNEVKSLFSDLKDLGKSGSYAELTTTMNVANVPIVFAELRRAIQTTEGFSNAVNLKDVTAEDIDTQPGRLVGDPNLWETKDSGIEELYARAAQLQDFKLFENTHHVLPNHYDTKPPQDFFEALGITVLNLQEWLDTNAPGEASPIWKIGAPRKITNEERIQLRADAEGIPDAFNYNYLANVIINKIQSNQPIKQLFYPDALAQSQTPKPHDVLIRLSNLIGSDSLATLLLIPEAAYWVLQTTAYVTKQHYVVLESEANSVQSGKTIYSSSEYKTPTFLVWRLPQLSRVVPVARLWRQIASIPHTKIGSFTAKDPLRTATQADFTDGISRQKARWLPRALSMLAGYASSQWFLGRQQRVIDKATGVVNNEAKGDAAATFAQWLIGGIASAGFPALSSLVLGIIGNATFFPFLLGASATGVAATVTAASNIIGYYIIETSIRLTLDGVRTWMTWDEKEQNRFNAALIKIRGNPIKEATTRHKRAIARTISMLTKQLNDVDNPPPRIYFQEAYEATEALFTINPRINLQNSIHSQTFVSIPPLAIRQQHHIAITQRGYHNPNQRLGVDDIDNYPILLAMREIADAVWDYRRNYSALIEYAQEPLTKRLAHRVAAVLKRVYVKKTVHVIAAEDLVWQQVYGGNATRLVLPYIPAAMHGKPTREMHQAVSDFASSLATMNVLPPTLAKPTALVDSYVRMSFTPNNKGGRLLVLSNLLAKKKFEGLEGRLPKELAPPVAAYEDNSNMKAVWASRRLDKSVLRFAIDKTLGKRHTHNKWGDLWSKSEEGDAIEDLAIALSRVPSTGAHFLHPYGSPLNLTPTRGSVGDRIVSTASIICRLDALNTLGESDIQDSFSDNLVSIGIIKPVAIPRGPLHDPYVLRAAMSNNSPSNNIANQVVIDVTLIREPITTLQDFLWVTDRLIAAFALARCAGNVNVSVQDAEGDVFALLISLAQECAHLDGFSVTIQSQHGDTSQWTTMLQTAPKTLTLMELLASVV